MGCRTTKTGDLLSRDSKSDEWDTRGPKVIAAENGESLHLYEWHGLRCRRAVRGFPPSIAACCTESRSG